MPKIFKDVWAWITAVDALRSIWSWIPALVVSLAMSIWAKIEGFPPSMLLFLFIICVACLLVLSNFVFKLIKHLKSKKATNKTLDSVSSNNTGYPDIKINGLFKYISDNVDLKASHPEMDANYPEAIIGKEVKDNISVGRLTIWGREADRFTLLDDDFSSNSLKELKFYNLDNFSFTFLWDNYDSSILLTGEAELQRRVHGKYREDRMETDYLDLRFNKAQMKSIWPEK